MLGSLEALLPGLNPFLGIAGFGGGTLHLLLWGRTGIWVLSLVELGSGSPRVTSCI